MPFVEDFDQFFSPADFGTLAIFRRGETELLQANVIFDAATQAQSAYDTNVEEAGPRLRCRADLLGEVRRKDSVEVDERFYEIKRLNHDGTGVCTVYLIPVANPVGA